MCVGTSIIYWVIQIYVSKQVYSLTIVGLVNLSWNIIKSHPKLISWVWNWLAPFGSPVQTPAVHVMGSHNSQEWVVSFICAPEPVTAVHGLGSWPTLCCVMFGDVPYTLFTMNINEQNSWWSRQVMQRIDTIFMFPCGCEHVCMNMCMFCLKKTCCWKTCLFIQGRNTVVLHWSTGLPWSLQPG